MIQAAGGGGKSAFNSTALAEDGELGESAENDNHIPGDGEAFQTMETPWSSDGSVWLRPL